MIVPAGKDCLTPGQESILLDIEKAVKSAHFTEVTHHRRFLDIQAKLVVRLFTGLLLHGVNLMSL